MVFSANAQIAAQNAWVHDLKPFVIRFSDTIGIRWYGLAYLSGFVIGALMMVFIAKRGRGTLRPGLVTDFMTYVVLGTMIGGRLGYAIFYGPELLTDFSAQFPYWGLFRVWQGGMASHGGILGVAIASAIFAWRYKLNWLHLGDLTTLGGSIGIFFGRLANFVNGELFGREAPTGFPFAVKFPTEMYLWLHQDLTSPAASPRLLKMTEAVRVLKGDSSGFVAAVQNLHNPHTSPEARAQIQSVISQLIEAIQNANGAVISALSPELTARYPSQLLEAALEGVCLFFLALFVWRKPRKPGVVGAVWLIGYALVRIAGEGFRMPDAQIGFELFGLSRGQWLSVVMLFFSIALFTYVSRTNSQPIGGWGGKLGQDAQSASAQDPR